MSNKTAKNSDSQEKKIELKPCKGSITRILMDEGMEGYNKAMEKRAEIEKQRREEWRKERMDEYCTLYERESDCIPFKVYDHILYNRTPWKSFREFLNQDENLRKEKMDSYNLLEEHEKEEKDEWIHHPLTGEYYNKSEAMRKREAETYDDLQENIECYSESEYEWESEYEDYEPTDDEEMSDDDLDYY